MQRDMQSQSVAPAATDMRGKHRISAELKRLEQETRCLEVTSLSYFDGFFFVLEVFILIEFSF